MPNAAKKQSEAKNKGGRPPVLVEDEATLKKVKQAASRLHTQGEAAELLGVAHSTFEGFLRNSSLAREAWDSGQQSGRGKLRQMQLKLAEDGHPSMLMWLGKQYLDQADKNENKHQHTLSVSQEFEQFLRQLHGETQAAPAAQVIDVTPEKRA